jgi:hypothetical protein
MRYKAFGLVFDSEIELPELIQVSTEAQADVCIYLGNVPTQIQGELLASDSNNWLSYQLGTDESIIYYQGIGRFYTRNGDTIIVEPLSEVPFSTIRVFLLGAVLGSLFHHRRALPLHGSAVATPKGAVIFLGNSGDGKSTLAAALANQGYKVIADDLSIIQLSQSDEIIVLPSYPQQKLWQDSLQILNRNFEAFTTVLSNSNKYFVPIKNQHGDSPVILRKLYILNCIKDDRQFRPVIKPLTGIDKLNMLAHVYGPKHQSVRRDTRLNLIVMTLIEQVKVAQLSYRKDLQGLEDLIDLIQQDFFSSL